MYTYDGLDRLTDADRGDLNAGKTAISTLAFAHEWGLDPLGNWSAFKEDADGNATWDLNQSREHNKVNEITAISESAGPSWDDPVYNLVGNMTTVPKPGDPTDTFTATYDAWNRLVALDDGAGDVATYEYDAMNRRITKVDQSGMSDVTYDYYYSSGWQVVEVRKGGDTDPYEQYVWGGRYIDDLVLRDRDADTNGVVDDTIYALHDANWNVVALANTTGDVQERYRYTAYGHPTVLDANYSVDGDGVSDYDIQVLYAGYRFDPESGLYHVRNRMYQPMLGTWITRDPAGYVDGYGLYVGYHAQLVGLDPSGLAFIQLPTRYTINWNQHLLGRTTIDWDIAFSCKPCSSGSQCYRLNLDVFDITVRVTVFYAYKKRIGGANDRVVIIYRSPTENHNTLIHEEHHVKAYRDFFNDNWPKAVNDVATITCSNPKTKAECDTKADLLTAIYNLRMSIVYEKEAIHHPDRWIPVGTRHYPRPGT